MSSNIVRNRTIRSTRGNNDNSTEAASRTDQLREAAHRVAKEQLIPRASKMQSNSIEVDRRDIYVYKKRTMGRECSCVTKEGMPEGNCQICYKVGFVGGFDKFGTHTEILDSTAKFSSYNIVIDYKSRPNMIRLATNASVGEIEWEFSLKQNINMVDIVQIVDFAPKGSLSEFYIWNTTSNIWETLNEETFRKRLNDHTVKIKARLTRTSTAFPSPLISHIFLRYNIRENLSISSDWPHVRDSRALSEYGIFNAWSTSELNIDNTIKNVTPDDWVYRSDLNERWKIIETDKFDQLQQVTGHNLTVRLIQHYESTQNFPL